MTHNATGGPTINYGQLPPLPGTTYVPEYNEDAAPSLSWGGGGMLDSRWGYYSSGGQPTALGFQGSTNIPILNVTPATLSATIIAASQAPTTAVGLNLATASTTGLTVLGAALTVYPSLTTIPVNTLALDGAPGYVVFEKNATATGGVQIYDPTKASARAVTIRNSAGDTSGYKISGADIYGYTMTEIIGASTAAGTFTGKKAFKFISTVIPQGTIASTSVAVGTSDVYGFPLRVDGYGDLDIVYANANIAASTGFTAAVTSTANSTTGDVRGTYALQAASNGTNVLQVFVTPRAANIGSISGLFGVTQA